MSINAVSEAVGFTYPYYFIRKFKELEGRYAGPVHWRADALDG